MNSEHFARHQRLLKPAEFKNVFAQSVKSGDKDLTLLGRVNNKPFARLGLAIPKRQLKKAVSRNRVKRLVRESFRKHQQILVGIDIVVLARFSADQRSNQELFAALEKHWIKLRKKCADSLLS